MDGCLEKSWGTVEVYLPQFPTALGATRSVVPLFRARDVSSKVSMNLSSYSCNSNGISNYEEVAVCANIASPDPLHGDSPVQTDHCVVHGDKCKYDNRDVYAQNKSLREICLLMVALLLVMSSYLVGVRVGEAQVPGPSSSVSDSLTWDKDMRSLSYISQVYSRRNGSITSDSVSPPVAIYYTGVHVCSPVIHFISVIA